MRETQVLGYAPGGPARSAWPLVSRGSLRTTLGRSLVWLAAVWSLSAGGAEVQRFTLEQSGNRYQVSITALVAAPLEAVWAVITDYAHLTRLSPAIRQSEILDADTMEGLRVRTSTRLCALIYCKDIKQVQRIVQRAPEEVESSTEPQDSDLAYGQARWQVVPARQGTRILIHFDLEPAFWIPPLIGPLVIKVALERETRNLMLGIERAARDDAGP